MTVTFKETRKEEVVRKRIPLGIPAMKLPLPDLKGYFCRWFNDEPGRIEQVLSAGYEFVEQEEAPGYGAIKVEGQDVGTRISRIVGMADTGLEPMRAYLMKLRQDWRDEDDRMKQALLDKTDAVIRGGSIGPNDGSRYIKNIVYDR